MRQPNLLNYDQAAILFAAAGLPSSTRTVRRQIWSHPNLCPLHDEGYHIKRVKRADVATLIRKLKRDRK